MQNKYLDSIVELYGEDFHIVSQERPWRSELPHSRADCRTPFFQTQVKVPLETSEIRGTEKLKQFSRYLTNPFQPPQ